MSIMIKMFGLGIRKTSTYNFTPPDLTLIKPIYP